VEGRRDDVVSLVAPDGSVVRLLPLAFSTVVKEAARWQRFQIVQTVPARLMLRLVAKPGSYRQAVWRSTADALRQYLARQSLSNVHVGLDRHGPVPDRRSGNVREVVVAIEEMRALPNIQPSGLRE
jgi:hypothetical protein